jgi:hypothetical protein
MDELHLPVLDLRFKPYINKMSQPIQVGETSLWRLNDGPSFVSPGEIRRYIAYKPEVYPTIFETKNLEAVEMQPNMLELFLLTATKSENSIRDGWRILQHIPSFAGTPEKVESQKRNIIARQLFTRALLVEQSIEDVYEVIKSFESEGKGASHNKEFGMRLEHRRADHNSSAIRKVLNVPEYDVSMVNLLVKGSSHILARYLPPAFLVGKNAEITAGFRVDEEGEPIDGGIAVVHYVTNTSNIGLDGVISPIVVGSAYPH